jgi:hypothetical protein
VILFLFLLWSVVIYDCGFWKLNSALLYNTNQIYMRKIYVSLIAFVSIPFFLLTVQSCKKDGFLGATNTTNLTQTTIFTDSANTEGFLANIYANVGFASSGSRFTYTTSTLSVIPCGGLDAACDESEISHTYSTTALAFAVGSVNAGVVTDDAFNTCYTQIRAVNQLFANIKTVPMKASNKAQVIAEARFLRAWYYFILLEHYGGVPIVGDKLYSYTQSIPEIRSTFDQTVTYIAAQCDTAAQTLPIIQTGQGYGRASGGACLALKARLYLYAASPLFNKPSGYPVQAPSDLATSAATKALVGYPSYMASRWATAEAAALAVIQTNLYSLNTDSLNTPGYGEESAFQVAFTLRPNNEYIFPFMENINNNVLENLYEPPSRSGSSNGAYPYQGMVDAFPMKNGKAITDPTSNYDPNNPYANRDPRLYASIIYDQALLGNRTTNGFLQGYSPVNIYLNSVNGTLQGGTDAVYQGTPTGYYNFKMLDPRALPASLTALTARDIPLIRYAEILLDYAEAANENEGPTANVYMAMNSIRARAGLVPSALPAGLSQTQMRTAIQNERRVELAYEGHRFWDVRRWLIADQTQNFQAQGMEVDRNGSATTYKIFTVRQHSFRTPMYLWPFPQSEIGKGAGLVQNPGY